MRRPSTAAIDDAWTETLHRLAVRSAVPCGKAVALLDVSGSMFRSLASEFGRVVALDPEGRKRDDLVPVNVELRAEEMSELSLSSGSIDVIVAVDAIGRSAGDDTRGLCEFARLADLLRPGGVCVIIDRERDAARATGVFDDCLRFGVAVGLSCTRRVPIRVGRPGLITRRLARRSDTVRERVAQHELRRLTGLSPRRLATESDVDWLIALRKDGPALRQPVHDKRP